MRRVFAQFSFRYARRRPGRTVATVLGVALGVVMIVATQMASDAALLSFVDLVETTAGKSELQVLPAAGSGFSDSYLEDVAEVDGVAGAYPVVTGSSLVVRDGEDVDALIVYGVDLERDREVRDYELADGVFPDGSAAQVLLTEAWAADLDIEVDDEVSLLTAEGVRDFTVAGLLAGTGVGATNAGRFAVVSLPRGQSMFSRDGRFDQIDVTVEPGFQVVQVEAGLAGVLGERLVVQRPASRGEDVEDTLESFRILVSFTASISLFVGLLIIFNNMSVGVEERRFHVAMLRALGLRRRRILALVLGEAALLGLVGGAIGLVLGIGVAQVLTSGMAGLSESLSRVFITETGFSAETVATGLVLGPVTAMLAAAGPAWSMLRVHPLEALAPDRTAEGPGARRLRTAGWALLVLGGIALAAFSAPSALGDSGLAFDDLLAIGTGGFFLMSTGVILLLPWMLNAVLSRLRVRSVPVRVAISNLVRSPGRTSATAAGVMLALSIVIAVSAQTDAIERYALDWVDDTIGWDMLVSSSFEGARMDVPIDDDAAAWIRESDAVEHAAALRFTTVAYEGTRVALQVFDMEELQHFVHWTLVDGDEDLVDERLASGGWVGVSQVVAQRYGVEAGDVIELPTPDGAIGLRVAGVVKDFSGDAGAIYIDQPAYARLWGDERIDGFDVKLAEGYEVSEVAAQLEAAVGEEAHVVIRTREEFTEGILAVIEQSMGLTSAVAYVAVLVAAAGIMNTALVSLLQRGREMSLLRALGARRGAIGRLLLGESLMIGLAGAILACGLGILIALALINGAVHYAGVEYEFRTPWTALAGALLLGAGLSALASWIPARTARRADIVTGLRYE